jgi:transcriptional regulator with XRE-family HTH domain
MKNKIQNYREQKNMTQAELAEKSGLSLRTVQRIEAGTVPKGHTLKSVAKALNVEPEELKSTGEMIFDLDRAKLINISSLCFLVLPFGNIILPSVLIAKTPDQETKRVGKSILGVQILWTVVLSILMIVSPFIQGLLLTRVPVFLVLLVTFMVFNVFIILKNAQDLNRKATLFLQLKNSIL